MRVPALMFVTGVLWADLALAADCAAPYTTDGLLGDLVTIEEFLRNGDDEAAGTVAKKLEAGLGCLNEVLPPMITGRAYRAVAAGLVASGDEARGGAWFRTAAEIEQAFEYGLEDLPEEHPVRDAFSAAKGNASGDVIAVEGQDLLPTGTHYLDGRKIDEAKARLDRPHLYQHEDGAVRSWILEGNAFPAEVLVAAVAVAVAEPEPAAKAPKPPKPPKAPKVAKVKEPKPPKEKAVEEAPEPEEKPEKVARTGKAEEPTSSGSGTVVLQRQRPWEKTPLMIGGGLVVAAGGGLYAMALGARGDFEGAGTLDDVEKFAKQANQLVLASAAVLAVGTGTLTWGVILDGGGSPLPALNVRF